MLWPESATQYPNPYRNWPLLVTLKLVAATIPSASNTVEEPGPFAPLPWTPHRLERVTASVQLVGAGARRVAALPLDRGFEDDGLRVVRPAVPAATRVARRDVIPGRPATRRE